MGYVSSVCSGGQSCAVLADHNVMGFISAIHELASRERHLYCWCSSVRKILLTPLRKRGQRASTASFCLIKTFIKISVCVFSHLQKVCVQCWVSSALISSSLSVRVLFSWAPWLADMPQHSPTSCIMCRAVMSLPFPCWHTQSISWTHTKGELVFFFCLTKQKSHHVIPSKKTWTDILMFMSVIPFLVFTLTVDCISYLICSTLPSELL